MVLNTIYTLTPAKLFLPLGTPDSSALLLSQRLHLDVTSYPELQSQWPENQTPIFLPTLLPVQPSTSHQMTTHDLPFAEPVTGITLDSFSEPTCNPQQSPMAFYSKRA